MSQGSLDPKNRFLGQKMSPVARVQTDRQTDTHKSEYRRHPFRVSGFFSFNLSSRIGPIYNMKTSQSQSITFRYLCEVELVPVDGSWGVWGDYGECSATCGDGTQARSRSCDSPAPADGGAECVGEHEETRSCNDGDCPGNWKPPF